jgi:hypothetical protein
MHRGRDGVIDPEPTLANRNAAVQQVLTAGSRAIFSVECGSTQKWVTRRGDHTAKR